ncbi:beta-ketoacyl synthase N-terminal-like domain-containing protein [Mucilaginibacter sp. L3T2-6]|nr:beta-ketoacyl synthase N-terminal-like domain-containing protein [Mucilaginibacter sp. L3T2-6]MDO3640841.1 beta-ketoacyl synthase N-terminal-like domain-containing protein [Mucilaginibacter sp. L3T2-6]MDV6213683.1 beta-ketoacyl synthase N-terminal-like domain-containing protein [Mucilaginibacter sp. L3T2-6]
MRSDVFIVADNIYSPLGKTTEENFLQLKNGVSSVKLHNDVNLSETPVYSSLFEDKKQFNLTVYTKFEQLLIASISDAIQNSDIDITKNTALIISSTKGNISLLETGKNGPDLYKRVSMTTSAKLVADYFGFQIPPIVVSNACISGVMAIITGTRLLHTGQYENAVVCGADVISRFVVSGFQSFQALSPSVCRPFEASRDGLNLGEGAATVVLSVNKKFKGQLKVKGGSISNDANHISGPSRTGEELSYAIKKAIQNAGLIPGDIDFISAHGTATPYNDEMEANAVRLAGLQSTPLNSLKGYYGHTLGAAGLIEAVVSMQSLKEGLMIPTPGFNELGVSSEVNVCAELTPIAATNFLKTASGFGGCNGAIVVVK